MSTDNKEDKKLRQIVVTGFGKWKRAMDAADTDAGVRAIKEAEQALKSRDQQIALDAQERVLEDLRESLSWDYDLESRYDYDYKIAESTIKAHNKIIAAKNAERKDIRDEVDELLSTIKEEK